MTHVRLIGVLAALALACLRPAHAQQVLYIEVIDAPPERASPLDWLDADRPLTLRELVRAVLLVADAPDLDGALIGLNNASLGQTQVEELGRAMLLARAAGKHVSVFASSYDQGGLMLASHADDVIIQSGGQVSLSGLYAEEMYLADALAWLGVRAELIQVGDYKGANEMMTRSSPSDAWNENMDGLLDGLFVEVQRPFLEGRGMREDAVERAFEQGWLASASEAQGLGLVDSVVDYAALGEHLAQYFGGRVGFVPADAVLRGFDSAAQAFDEWAAEEDDEEPGEGSDTLSGEADDPSGLRGLLEMFESVVDANETRAPEGPTIAVVHVDGPIIDGLSQYGRGTGGENMVGSATIREVFERLAQDDAIRGIVVRVDSPGGSATASEVIWQGMRRLAESKPVWVSVGSMAASGGYYTAVGASRIYANPSSVVGSIGVVGGKFALGGLYDRLNVNVTGRARGPHAAMWSSDVEWTDEQRTLVRGRMQQTYDLFAERVRDGRPRADLDRVGEGRLFTGRQALALGMVDSLGGLDEATEDMSISLGLIDYEVRHYPEPDSLVSVIRAVLESGGVPSVEAAMPEPLNAVRAAVGERAWRDLRRSIAAAELIRDERVLLIAPRTLIFR